MPTVKHFLRRQCGHQLRVALSTAHVPVPAEKIVPDFTSDDAVRRSVNYHARINKPMHANRAPRRTDRLKKQEQPSQQ